MTTADEGDGCVFCDHLTENDDETAHILFRGRDVFVILNAFPYNTGHLMIAPIEHVAELKDLSREQRAELFERTSQSVDVLTEGLAPHGFNIGMNLGTVAGAGIPGHLHLHVVPRWGGDTNFMPIVGDTKVLPEMIADTDAKLRPLFARLT